jgi:RNA-directed DNA polymerase
MSHDTHHRYEWNAIPWRKLEVRVFKLQRRIYQATTRGEVKKAHRLQKLLAASWSAKSLAVRRVTQENTGKKTAGVDGVKNLTPPQRLQLISDIDLHTPVKPVRRVWIDKPGTPEKRPLGIPIMHDRATQALVKLAAEPEWEAKFEPNSFGFRPGRSCQDALQQIFLTIQRRPRYVLDADIASCFDKIDQAALLEKIHTSPHFARPIKEWLKAGVVDRGIFMPTDQGTPQGGVLSPLLANIALHGLEDAVQKTRGPATIVRGGKRVTNNVYCIRYADDFVVFHNTWEGIQRCKEAIQEWLQGMGLALKDAKTRFAHTLEAKEECGGNVGFDFLGFTVRQFPVGKDQTKTHASYKTIIKPSKSSIQRHYQELAAVIEGMKAAPIDDVIRAINPKIIGWCNYYKNAVSTRAFQKLEHMLWYKIFSWAKRKHPKKSAKWVFEKYHKRTGKAWSIAGNTQVLRKHGDTHIERHTPLHRGASPYDGNWSYWGTRRGKYIGLDTARGKLLKHQGGRCTHCQLFFTVDDQLEIHHADGNHKNRKLDNLRLLHRICHDLVHGKRGKQCTT